MTQESEPTSIPSPTKEISKNIQAIDKEAVHRICSGQVVLNLATAVKELVENSLDAGATSIEIRLREYGSELVEVIDNGCGVEEANFEGLTLKHHTSKLREFSDLLGVETFGFRGEALSSLCALSELTVTTKHVSSEMGTKLIYDSRGFIISKSPCARQVGTTVSLANLFSPLPVRQKEFLRNLKREFIKMSQLLHAYCLISTGVKILCSNQTKKGGKSVVVSTQGSPTFKGNIMCIFGSKQANCLLDIEVESPSASHLEEIGLTSNVDAINKFELEGCISSCAHGHGRSSTDRQFYYINNRPCDPSKVSKVVNEVYHQFNLHQFPFVFLNIKTARDSVDVNVTPDKRQIFLDNEKLLIASVKASLLKLYEKVPHTYQVQNAAIGPCKSMSDVSSSTIQPLNSSPSSTTTSSSLNKIGNFSSLLKNFSHSSNKSGTSQDNQPSQRDNTGIKPGRGIKRTLSSSNHDRDGKKQLCLSDFVSQKQTSCVDHTSSELVQEGKDCELSATEDVKCVDGDSQSTVHLKEELSSCGVKSTDFIVSGAVSRNTESSVLEEDEGNVWKTEPKAPDMNIKSDKHSERYDNIVSEQQLPHSARNEDTLENNVSHSFEMENLSSESKSVCITVLTDNDPRKSKRKTVNFKVDILKVRTIIEKKSMLSKKGDTEFTADVRPRVRFYAEIDPSKNKSAEQELSKEISKDMFSQMEIIGQFNLGFIVTKLGNDLFIVDQHATDEKYNFETLQAQTTLKNQKLVIPQSLDLTAVNECILMDNLDIFIKNGFEFVFDKDAEPTKRVRLAAKPISHNWEFGKEDIDELLFMLQDSPHTMCRPSRVRAMFASRACRKSVMIGTALSKSTMRQLVNHMGEIDQPWNCPHGRPTMRHLVNLELIRKTK